MFHDYLRGSLEALLFAAGEPLSVAKLAQIMHLDNHLVWQKVINYVQKNSIMN